MQGIVDLLRSSAATTLTERPAVAAPENGCSGAGRPVLHTGGARIGRPGVERPDSHTGSGRYQQRDCGRQPQGSRVHPRTRQREGPAGDKLSRSDDDGYGGRDGASEANGNFLGRCRSLAAEGQRLPKRPAVAAPENGCSGAERSVLHTGGARNGRPGAGRPVLHTGGARNGRPGAERPDSHTGGARNGRPGAGRPDLHTGGGGNGRPGAGRPVLHTGGGG